MTSNDDLPPTTAEVTTTLTKPEEAVPYIWAECHPPAEETLQLWVEVGNKLEKEATVVWSQSVESLSEANKYLPVSREARDFVETYMGQIVSILLEQQPAKVGNNERRCVHESLHLAVSIISKDLKIQIERGSRSPSGDPNEVECKTLRVLSCLLNKKKTYYKGTKSTWNVQNLSGLPLIRLNLVEKFLNEEGFVRLEEYMNDRIVIVDVDVNIDIDIDVDNNYNNATTTTMLTTATEINTGGPSNNNSTSNSSVEVATSTAAATALSPTTSSQRQRQQLSSSSQLSSSLPSAQPATAVVVTSSVASSFPTIDILHHVLPALLDSYNAATHQYNNNNHKSEKNANSLEQATVDVSKTVMRYITSCSEESLKKICMDELKFLLHDLHRIFDRLMQTRRDDTNEFYVFWRALVLKLITSQSLPLKLFGWQQMETLMQACEDHRPPPRSFLAYDSGCSFVNGEYHFVGVVTDDGYGLRSQNNDISYERAIPVDEPDGGGKKLTLFRCTMRSQQKWWFLSEADEEQPGTDRDIDYYQHKSKEHEEMEPPPSGWLTCRNAGIDPSPKLKRMGSMVPPNEECNTLEHQLAKWAIRNKIIETLVLGDSVHREIVSRSVPLIKFLASMCERGEDVNDGKGNSNDGTTDDETTESAIAIAIATVTDRAKIKTKTAATTSTTENTASSQTTIEEEGLISNNIVCDGGGIVMTKSTVSKNEGSNNTAYCLQTSHLLLAWKTCIRKTDAAVSAQIYQLLVTVLFSCPSSLAVSLLEAVHDSLVQGQSSTSDNSNGINNSPAHISSNNNTIIKYDDCLNEVSDFCEALAVANYNNNNNNNTDNNTENNDEMTYDGGTRGVEQLQQQLWEEIRQVAKKRHNNNTTTIFGDVM
mmetsp:Transcript_19973/g.22290  ORF Transcript_19973/g.22290 Transcript_19973/m.22290 type:complete len:878 (+) Transcript_19973:39-2672(+)